MSPAGPTSLKSGPVVAGRLGTFAGVFTPSILTILGIILFLRLGYVVGAGGLPEALLIIALANGISVLTSLSLAAVATNLRVRGGGDYYLISRTLGMSFGGAIGVVLFLAQAISVAFYAIGFGEALAATLGRPEPWLPQAIALAALLVLFVLTWVGADIATRFQFVIMAVLFAALGSFFLGAAEHFSGEVFAASHRPALNLPFWALFAIFFPAVTGFTQGVSMSGDLKEPGKSIPVGTFLAVGISAVIYFGVALLMAGSLPNDALAANYDAMRQVSRFTWLADAGVMAATFSSALASFLGAPRILQSLARDRIFPALGFFATGHGPTENPRAGILLAGAIAVATVALGRLNVIAPIVSMFFLISYGLLNFATYFEARSNSPSFRPRFRFFDKRLSLVGGLGCFGVMVALNPLAGAIALLILWALYAYVKRRAAVERWADSSHAIRFQEVRDHLIGLSEEIEHPRDWRPVLMAFSDNPARRERILRFASWIEGRSGLTTIVQLIRGEGATGRRARDEALAALRGEIAKSQVEAFPLVVYGRDVETAIPVLLQSHGLGSIRTNTVLLNWYDRAPGTESMPGLRAYGHYLQLARREGCNLLVLETNPEDLEALAARPTHERRIDVWSQPGPTGRLMLLLAYLMTRTDDWAGASIRLCVVPQPGVSETETLTRVSGMLDDVRIDASVQVVPASTRDAILATSRASSFVFIPFHLRGTEIVVPFEGDPGSLLEALPLTALTLAAQDLELDAAPEEGAHADLARAADAAERAAAAAQHMGEKLEAARQELARIRGELEALRAAVPPDAAAIEARERELAAAESDIDRLTRRLDRARAKVQLGEDEVHALIEENTEVPPARKNHDAGANSEENG